MKDLLFSWLVLVMGGMLVLFMAISFTKLSFNPVVWNEETRAGFAIGTVIWMLLISFFAFLRLANEHEE